MGSSAPNLSSAMRAPKWVEASLAVHHNLVDSQNMERRSAEEADHNAASPGASVIKRTKLSTEVQSTELL
jgi:hypothetical protein